MQQGIQAITFDFYGTLVRHSFAEGGRGRALTRYFEMSGLRAEPWQHQVLYEVFERHHRDYSPEDAPDRKQAYQERLAARMLQRLGVGPEEADPAEHASKIWEIIGPSSLQLHAGAAETLRTLQKWGYRLAVVSNWHCGLANFCTELELGRFFDSVIASAECGIEKPDRRIFELAAERLRIPPDQIVHVGDSPREDIAGAQSARMKAIRIDRSAPRPSGGIVTELRQLTDPPTCLARPEGSGS